MAYERYDSASASQGPKETLASCLHRAGELVPVIKARAARTESERCVPEETIAELLDAGLFEVLKPRTFGGYELGVAALVEITTTLGAACGSTGWVYGVLAGHGWLVNLFPIEAQREVLADPRSLTATVFRLNGQATRVDGGYRITNATGRFCSGIDHASWVILGNSVVDESGSPEPRFFVVPRGDIEIVDDWFSLGLRGTGSRSIEIADAFVPEHRSVTVEALSKGLSPGAEFHRTPLHRTPFQLVAPFPIIGAPLGIARGAVDVFANGLKPWLEQSTDVELAGKAATYTRLARASAEIDAAHALVHADASYIDAMTSAPSALDRARIPRGWAYAAQTARAAVSDLFAAAGGSATFDDSEIQRHWRDVNSASQHYAFVWDNAMSDYGRVLLGLPAINSIPGKRK
jgi:3-hydroxy-9,10-secoandrosta-1,3,5(10)-triene-9,17-dione monooxygenase